jgi:hypothetical protein
VVGVGEPCMLAHRAPCMRWRDDISIVFKLPRGADARLPNLALFTAPCLFWCETCREHSQRPRLRRMDEPDDGPPAPATAEGLPRCALRLPPCAPRAISDPLPIDPLLRSQPRLPSWSRSGSHRLSGRAKTHYLFCMTARRVCVACLMPCARFTAQAPADLPRCPM